MLQVVYELSSFLSENVRRALNEESSAGTEVRKSFKLPIDIHVPQNYDQDFSFLADMTPPALGAEAAVAQNFSMKHKKKRVTADAAAGPSKEEEKLTLSWLSKHVNPDLLTSAIDLIKSPRSNEELQNELFDMMGFDKFEEIQLILGNRKKLIKKLETVEKKQKIIEKESQDKLKSHVPEYLVPAVVLTDKEKKLMKQIRKEEKRLKRNDDEPDELETLDPARLRLNLQKSYLNTLVQQPVLQARTKPLVIRTSKYPNVYDSFANAKQHIGFLAGGKVLLPERAERIDNPKYEEVKIPANDPPPLEVGSVRIKISDLDEISQIAFKGTKELNRIQTVVYPTAYHSNENLLICAPTGAGKTNVAMLTIVRTILAHADQGVIHRDAFKIVYVAPMKALAAEMTSNFGKKLAPLGISVRELTGDMQLTKTEMAATQVLVTTPEKWDVVTRKGAGDVAMISLVKLLIIDEVHLLHGDRGPVVEALVSFFLALATPCRQFFNGHFEFYEL